MRFIFHLLRRAIMAIVTTVRELERRLLDHFRRGEVAIAEHDPPAWPPADPRAALRSGELDDEQETELLEDLFRQARRRQGIPEPEDK